MPWAPGRVRLVSTTSQLKPQTLWNEVAGEILSLKNTWPSIDARPTVEFYRSLIFPSFTTHLFWITRHRLSQYGDASELCTLRPSRQRLPTLNFNARYAHFSDMNEAIRTVQKCRL